jgi:hypothetical protein
MTPRSVSTRSRDHGTIERAIHYWGALDFAAFTPCRNTPYFPRICGLAQDGYLHAYDCVAAAKAGIGSYFSFYNSERAHTALDRNTPDNVYFESQPLAAAA